jgi:FkbM family methyltransferase
MKINFLDKYYLSKFLKKLLELKKDDFFIFYYELIKNLKIEDRVKIDQIILEIGLDRKGYITNPENHKQTIDLIPSEKKAINKIISLLKEKNEKKIFFDIGANFGNFTKVFLELLPPSLDFECYCFEPMQECMIKLKENLKKFKNVNFINQGVSNKIGEQEIFYGDELGLSSFDEDVFKLDNIGPKLTKKKMLKTITLDTFCEKEKISKIDILKIDVEGFKNNVLKGAKNLIDNNKINCIQMEYNTHHLFKGHSIYYFSKLLQNFDIFMISNDHNSLRKISPSDPLDNIFLHSNFWWIKKEIYKL